MQELKLMIPNWKEHEIFSGYFDGREDTFCLSAKETI